MKVENIGICEICKEMSITLQAGVCRSCQIEENQFLEVCPGCQKILGQADYRDEIDPDTGGGEVWISCRTCKYDELEEEREHRFELMFS